VAVTIVDQDRIISDLAAVWSSFGALLAELDEDEWTTSTGLPGWDVRSVVAHVIGTESMLLGEPTPADEIDPAEYAHVRNDMGRLNEAWVASMRDASPSELQQRFADHAGRRLGGLRAMDSDAWGGEGVTPVGRDTYGRFMRIRVFDCWVHEQDVRDAVGRPGHESGPAVETVLDEMSTALGYVVGKQAGAPAGSRITFELTGDSGRTIHVEVGERAAVVDELGGAPTVTITMPTGVFTRLAAGRMAVDAVRDLITIDGDTELGERILANLTYTM
jgi:uncharacterized protein (TIGR03083 family)